MTDKQMLQIWYTYAANKPGFIGEALRAQRGKAFLFQQQQRALIGIRGEQYDFLWLRLQAMFLPRAEQFSIDVSRIVAKVEADAGIAGAIHLGQLEVLLREGMA